MTFDEAIAHLGADHVDYCLRNLGRLEVLTSGAWLANNARAYIAYLAVCRQAGIK